MSIIKLNDEPLIYNIKLPLEGNPLRDLNVYAIVSGEGSKREALIIDTGFNMECCRTALMEGIRELGIPMDRIKLFLTHMHSDHTGQADIFAEAGCPIYMSPLDAEYLTKSLAGALREPSNRRFITNGFPADVLKVLRTENPIYKNSLKNGMIDTIPANDGDIITVGDIELQCVFTPGHTPGHTCLYIEKDEILFTGDHVLYDITPNITAWTGVADSLENYIRSLKRVDALSFKTAYPAHRELHDDPHGRIKEILHHHSLRLDEALNILRKKPGITAYEITSMMKWSIRAKNWDDFPIAQKWFAQGEAMAHLHWLERRGYVETETDFDGNILYYNAAGGWGEFSL